MQSGESLATHTFSESGSLFSLGEQRGYSSLTVGNVPEFANREAPLLVLEMNPVFVCMSYKDVLPVLGLGVTNDQS